MEKSAKGVSIDLSQKNEFQENGYFTLINFSNSEEIEHLLSKISQFKDDLGIRKKKTIYAIRNLLDDESIKEFANSEKVLIAVEEFLSGKAHPVRAIYFDKTQDSNWFVNWHQDLSIAIQKNDSTVSSVANTLMMLPAASKEVSKETPSNPPFQGEASELLPDQNKNSWGWVGLSDATGTGKFNLQGLKAGELHMQAPQHILENMLTFRLHLDDCDENNGPLQVIPASHKGGIIPVENLKEISLEHKHLCKAQKGDAFIMKPLLLHSSTKSVNVNHRRILHIEFCAEHAMQSINWRWK